MTSCTGDASRPSSTRDSLSSSPRHAAPTNGPIRSPLRSPIFSQSHGPAAHEKRAAHDPADRQAAILQEGQAVSGVDLGPEAHGQAGRSVERCGEKSSGSSKLDVRKAFDSVSQTYLPRLPGTRWISSKQNGVRQGSPDSPSLFSAGIAGIGEALDEVTAEMHGQSMRGPDKESQRIPPAPHGLSAFMDDAYVWGASPEMDSSAAALLLLERALAKRGLRINPGKTFIMASKEPAGSFQARRSKRMAQQL